jgi:hypothetical protein
MARNALPSGGQLGLVHIPQQHERQEQEHARVGVTGSPQILTQPIIFIPGLTANQQSEDAESTQDNRGIDNEKDCCQPSGFACHRSLPFGRISRTCDSCPRLVS